MKDVEPLNEQIFNSSVTVINFILELSLPGRQTTGPSMLDEIIMKHVMVIKLKLSQIPILLYVMTSTHT